MWNLNHKKSSPNLINRYKFVKLLEFLLNSQRLGFWIIWSVSVKIRGFDVFHLTVNSYQSLVGTFLTFQFQTKRNRSGQSITSNTNNEIVASKIISMNLLLLLLNNKTQKCSNYRRFIIHYNFSCPFVYQQWKFINVCRSHNLYIVLLHCFLIFIFVQQLDWNSS